MIHTVLAGFTFLLVSMSIVQACEIDNGNKTNTASFEKGIIKWISKPTEIRVGQPFTMHVKLCDKAGRAFASDLNLGATMPAHGHGMNYKPEIMKRSVGEFEATGFVFHMPGLWQIDFKIRQGEKMFVVPVTYEIK